MAAQLRCRRFVLGEWLYRSQHSSNRLYCRRFICVESVGLASPIPYPLVRNIYKRSDGRHTIEWYRL